MSEIEEQLRRAAPKPTGELDIGEISRRASLLDRRRTFRRVVTAGAVAVVLLVVGALWVQGSDEPTTVVEDKVHVADDPVASETTTLTSAPVEVSLVTTTFVAEGFYRCETGEASTAVASSVVTQTWSDPENERWASRTEFESGPVEQLAFGNPAYPTQVFRRGEFPETPSPCTPGHPAGQVVNFVEGGGPGVGAIRGVPVMSEDQQRSLEGLRHTYRDTGVESGAGADSLGRAAVIWEHNVEGYMALGDEQVPLDQRQQWFVEPATGRVLEETATSTYGDFGEFHSTTTYSESTLVMIDAEQFDPVGYTDETESWLTNRYPIYAATPSSSDLSIGTEWIWPVEPRPIEAAALVAAFAEEVLDTPDALIEADVDGLPGTFDVGVGELAMSIRTAEVPAGVVVVDVTSAGFNGSQGVKPLVAPGAVLSIEVPSVASSYTIVVAEADGATSWTADGIEVTAMATTTLSSDGIEVFEDNAAKAAITIPGLTYADAERVLVIGRDANGTLKHVAADLRIGS